MARPKNKRDVAPRLIWALDEALNLLQTQSGKDVAQHIANDMKEHGIGPVVKQFAHLFPKQIDMNIDQRVTLDTTKVSDEDWGFVSEIRKKIADESVTH